MCNHMIDVILSTAFSNKPKPPRNADFLAPRAPIYCANTWRQWRKELQSSIVERKCKRTSMLLASRMHPHRMSSRHCSSFDRPSLSPLLPISCITGFPSTWPYSCSYYLSSFPFLATMQLSTFSLHKLALTLLKPTPIVLRFTSYCGTDLPACIIYKYNNCQSRLLPSRVIPPHGCLPSLAPIGRATG